MNERIDTVDERPLEKGAPPVRRTRADQLEANRAALIKAAAQVVGEEGYSKASVVKITTVAGLGQGTFYTYFSSRQELFDILLPEVGEEMRQFMRERVRSMHSVIDIEEGSYRAFVDYVQANPWYGRILFEAEMMAPAASQANAHEVVTQHIALLSESWERGELPDYTREQIPALSSVLLALRRHFVRSRMASFEPALPAAILVEVSVQVIRRALRPSVPGH